MTPSSNIMAGEGADVDQGSVDALPVRVHRVRIDPTDLGAHEPLIRAAERILNARAVLDECVTVIEDLGAELKAAELDLSRRVLSKRQRDSRHRERKRQQEADGHIHNGRQADTRLVLTSNGLITECLRCGREVKS
jgi:hypothetical protein